MVQRIVSGLRLENDSTPEGENWWKWSVWVEGLSQELDEVQFVTYRLHPSFPNPVIDIREASTKFRLTSAGWGEFTITADAHLKSGGSVRLERWLQLQGGAQSKGNPSERQRRRPSVFLSHSVADTGVVDTLRHELIRQGVDVWTDEQCLVAGAEWESALQKPLQTADMVVAVFSDPPSRFVAQEAIRALDAGQTVVPVVLGKAEVDAKLSKIGRFELPDLQHVTALADRLVAQVKDRVIEDV